MRRFQVSAAMIGLAACASFTGALAETLPPAQNLIAPVTVESRKLSDKEMIKTVIAPFVDLHAARDRKTGLMVRAPRSGVCPLTLGLSPAFNAFVTARVVAVARQVGSPVDKAVRCTPNVEVVFTQNPQGLVDRLSDRTGGRILGFHFAAETGALGRVSRPIQAWYMTGTLNLRPPEATRVLDMVAPEGQSAANPLAFQANPPIQVSAPPDVVTDSAYSREPFFGTGSRLLLRNQSEIENVLVVADLNKLDGHEIGPIADYVTMLALTQPRSLDACNKLPSILDMLASGCQGDQAPQALTDSDMAFLKALYGSDITTTGDHGRENVALCMVHGAGDAQAASQDPTAHPACGRGAAK